MGRALAIALLLLAVPVLSTAQIRAEVIARGLRNPVAVVVDPLDRAVLFVAEQGGVIRVVRDGQPLAEPFLDLRNQVSTGGERGLLGLAFSPDTPSRGASSSSSPIATATP